MREIRTYGSEGGGSLDLPTPIRTKARNGLGIHQHWKRSREHCLFWVVGP